MKLVRTAAELYKEIKQRGLDLREGNGRDDVLIEQLAAKLGGATRRRLEITLAKSSITIERLVYAFFSLLHPFARMYSDIYRVMEEHAAKRATQSIRILFNFQSKAGTETLDFDLNHFREVQELWTKRLTSVRLWSYQDFNKVFEIYRKLRAYQITAPAQHHEHYLPGKPFQLPSVPIQISKPLFVMLDTIRQAMQTVIDRAANDYRDADPEAQELHQTSMLLTDLIPGFSTLTDMLQLPEGEHSLGRDRVQDAVGYFDKEILPHLQKSARKQEDLARELLDVLNLPFWNKRWYLYEVWSTFQVVLALHEYHISLTLDGDTLKLEEGRPCCVAEFTTVSGDKCRLWAQHRTPIDFPGRKGIMPDLRICVGSAEAPEDTLAAFEYKQRRQMDRREMEELLNLYAVGMPASLRNFYFNYDRFPSGITEDLAAQMRSQLFSFMHPGRPDVVQAFRAALLEVLAHGGYQPSKPLDLLLIDVSSSMGGILSTRLALITIEAIIRILENAPLYFFHTKLIVPQRGSPADVTDQIAHYLRGATHLESALQELGHLHPEAERVVIITDKEYGTAPTLRTYQEVLEGLPEEVFEILSRRHMESFLENRKSHHAE